MKKICTECGKPKDLNLFHRNKLKKDGRATKCAECLNVAGRKATKESGIGTTKASKTKLPKNKIICDRNNRQIFKKDCIPGCNDACQSCKNPQLRNVKAGGESCTAEEDVEQRRTGLYRSSALLTVETM